jgi:hypothetical protein
MCLNSGWNGKLTGGGGGSKGRRERNVVCFQGFEAGGGASCHVSRQCMYLSSTCSTDYGLTTLPLCAVRLGALPQQRHPHDRPGQLSNRGGPEIAQERGTLGGSGGSIQGLTTPAVQAANTRATPQLVVRLQRQP